MSEDVRVAGYADDLRQLENYQLLTRSLRSFGGRFSNVAVHVYTKPDLASGFFHSSEGAAFVLHDFQAPAEKTFWYSSKVFAAARAEKEAASVTPRLVWLDDDTLILDEANALFEAGAGMAAFRPVMHTNIGWKENTPVHPVWSRSLELSWASQEDLISLRTPAFGERVLGYINAGCLSVDPASGLFSAWAEAWERLRGDDVVRTHFNGDRRWQIFLHQVALSCVFARVTPAEQRLLLDPRYNYPLFFREMFGADRNFHDLDEALTLRHENSVRGALPNWFTLLRGRPGFQSWLQEQAETVL